MLSVRPAVAMGKLLACLVLAGATLAGEVTPTPVPTPVPTPTPAPTPAPAAVAPPAVELSDEQLAAQLKGIANPEYLAALAEVHQRFGATDLALQLYKKALALQQDPKRKASLHGTLGNLYKVRKDWKSAAEELNAAQELAADFSERSRYAMSLVDLYTQTQELEKAEKLLRGLMEAQSQQPGRKDETGWARRSAQQRLIQLWQKIPGKIEEAIKEAEAALQKNPQDEAALDRLSEIYSLGTKPDPAKAALVYEKLIELNPKDQNLYHRLAQAYQQTKQYDKAVEVYKKLMATTPKESAQHLVILVAQMYLNGGKKEEALAFLKENGDLSSKQPGTCAQYGSFYGQAGMHAEAEELFLKAAAGARSPQEETSYVTQAAESARQRKDYVKAEAQLRGLLQKYPESKDIRAQVNSALFRLLEEQGKTGDLKLDK